MINFMVFESKYFGKAAADFVERRHGDERLPAVEAGDLRRGHRNRIEVVVTEFSSRGAAIGVVAEVGYVCVPFAYGRRAGENCFFRRYRDVAPEHRNPALVRSRTVLKRFAAKDRRRVRASRQRAYATGNAVEMELFHLTK